MKKAVYNSYGIKHHIKGEYEVDHLVALELGGSNDITNLWPEPYHGSMNAHEKDKAENAAHKAVCAGRITLREAQEQMSKDWVVLYRRLVEEHP